MERKLMSKHMTLNMRTGMMMEEETSLRSFSDEQLDIAPEKGYRIQR
jgi:hypothetical protein